MTRYLPVLAGVLLIVGLTILQGGMTDRLQGTNVTAEQCAELLKLVPKNFGDWTSDDKPVDERVKKTAGAIGTPVSRAYRNSRTGEKVDLWLIVGHARDIAFHTPDVCYPGSGFEARAKENGLFPLVISGRADTPFWTNTFYKEDELHGRQLIRVFWTWFNPKSLTDDGQVVWEAPANARWHFGNTRALYKMYFTSEMRDPMETAEQSPCVHFAKDFLPEVEKALATVSHEGAPGSATQPAAEKSTEGSAATPNTEQPADTSAAPTGENLTESASKGTFQQLPSAAPADESAAKQAPAETPKSEH